MTDDRTELQEMETGIVMGYRYCTQVVERHVRLLRGAIGETFFL